MTIDEKICLEKCCFCKFKMNQVVELIRKHHSRASDNCKNESEWRKKWFEIKHHLHKPIMWSNINKWRVTESYFQLYFKCHSDSANWILFTQMKIFIGSTQYWFKICSIDKNDVIFGQHFLYKFQLTNEILGFGRMKNMLFNWHVSRYTKMHN